MTTDYVERARALVGTRYRLHGRAAGGLDCVGVITSTFGIDDDSVRADYGVRSHDRDEIEHGLIEHFRRVGVGAIKPGDVLLMSLGNGRFHLGVRTSEGFVHAHAGIRRVVETPGVPDWPISGGFRRRARKRRG